MMLIADSGSTKTHWTLTYDDGIVRSEIYTMGLNPHLTSDDQLKEVFSQVKNQLSDSLLISDSSQASLYYYGAGCGTVEMCQKVRELLATVFRSWRIEVEGDLLGACRSLCGSHQGLVGILGTGSNSCYYDGTKIANHRFSTGYILGDEGSGNHVGRCLLKAYLEGQMPAELSASFASFCGITKSQLLECLYQKPQPSRFLASLVPFAVDHRSDTFIKELTRGAFTSFFKGVKTLLPSTGSSALSLIGGMAKEWETELRELAEEEGLMIAKIEQEPMEGLLKYHRCK